ncbi:MAG: hypothetical protein GTO22_23795, partial [Gemmatimonadales bacterium]|nr:hypothetical protein [Gemmatimonadales bacterium]
MTGMSVLDLPAGTIPDIPVSESIPVTVRTTLHNNGPYGPVSVDLSYGRAASR